MPKHHVLRLELRELPPDRVFERAEAAELIDDYEALIRTLQLRGQRMLDSADLETLIAALETNIREIRRHTRPDRPS